jgi:hypothetical protein
MVGYHPVDADDLSLGTAKFVLGIADHQRNLQAIFFTQQLSYTSQLRACGLQHQKPPWQYRDQKNPSRRGPALFMRGRAPALYPVSVWMPESCRTWSGLTEVCRSIVERCQTEKGGGKLAAKKRNLLHPLQVKRRESSLHANTSAGPVYTSADEMTLTVSIAINCK